MSAQHRTPFDELPDFLELPRLAGLALLSTTRTSPTPSTPDVARLRQILVELDEAVMTAYGWDDVPLEHGFHTYRQMRRWTVSPPARVEILDRLLEENHRRAAAQGEASPPARDRGHRGKVSDHVHNEAGDPSSREEQPEQSDGSPAGVPPRWPRPVPPGGCTRHRPLAHRRDRADPNAAEDSAPSRPRSGRRRSGRPVRRPRPGVRGVGRASG
ncbi:MAG: hypothetical protein ACR2NR_20540 [Solirubrobacteraceae bacterium]